MKRTRTPQTLAFLMSCVLTFVSGLIEDERAVGCLCLSCVIAMIGLALECNYQDWEDDQEEARQNQEAFDMLEKDHG